MFYIVPGTLVTDVRSVDGRDRLPTLTAILTMTLIVVATCALTSSQNISDC